VRFDFGMTDLEDGLRGPEAREIQAALLTRFTELGEKIAARMKEGVAPAQFGDLKQVYDAVASAHMIVLKFPVK